jgi:hypothetical protein
MRYETKLKIGLIITAVLAVIIVAVLPLTAQDRYSTDRAAAIVNDKGIGIGAPMKYRTLLDEFDIFNTADWDTTSNSSGVVTSSADSTLAFYSGGPLIMVTKAAAQANGHVRWKGQGYQFKGTRKAEFETRIAFRDTTGASWVVGMTTLTDSLGATGIVPAAGAYFLKKAADSRIYAVVITAAGVADTTATGVSLARMTFARLSFTWNGNRLQFYVNGVSRVIQTAAETPDSPIFPVFALRANTAAVQKLYIDYVYVNQQRL